MNALMQIILKTFFFLLFQVHLLKFLLIFILQVHTTKEITMCIQNLNVLTAFMWLIYLLIIKNTFWFTWENDLMAVHCVERRSFVKIISNAMLLLAISNQLNFLLLELLLFSPCHTEIQNIFQHNTDLRKIKFLRVALKFFIFCLENGSLSDNYFLYCLTYHL